MAAKFASRAYVEQGEILHVLGLRLTLSRQGLLDHDIKTVLEQDKAYIDDLKARGQLPAFAKELGEDFRAFGGLGYSGRDTAEFREVLTYLLQRQREVLEESYPDLGEELLKEMAIDHNLFWRRINYSDTGDTRYANTPIFAIVAPDRFVDSVLALPADPVFSVLNAMSSRYQHGSLARDLKSERPWLGEVRKLMLARAASSSPIRASRITQLVSWTVGKVLDDLDTAERELAGAE